MRRLRLLYLAVFLMMFGLAGQTVGVPLTAKREFGASVWQLAMLGMTTALGYSVFCMATGALVGRVRPIKAAMAGAVLYGGSLLFGIWAGNFWHLVAIVAAGSVGSAVFWPMIESAIAEGASGRNLSRRIGVFNTSWSLGDVCGMVTAGALYDVWPRLPFIMLVASVGGVVAAVAFARRSPVAAERRPAAGEEQDRENVFEAAASLNSRFRRASRVGNFVSAGVMNVIRSIFADAATDVFRMSGSLYGLAIGTVNVCRTLCFWILTRWRDWHYRRAIYAWGASLLAVGMGGVVVAAFLPRPVGVPLVFVSFALAGLSIGVTYYSSIFYSVHDEAVVESQTRLHEAVIGAGGAAAVLGSGAANQLARTASPAVGALGMLAPASPFIMCAAAVLVGVAVSWRLIVGRGDKTEPLAQSPPSGYPDVAQQGLRSPAAAPGKQ